MSDSAQRGLKALVVGATGATGSCLVKQLVASDKWSRVITLGRRALSLEGDLASKAQGKLDQRTINMDEMEAEAAAAFEGVDSVFCALGTTRGDAGSAAQFRKIDLEYVQETARLAKLAGCRHFSLVSATGANANAWSSDLRLFTGFLYMKTKGQAEEAVKAQGFEYVSIARPGFLVRGSHQRTAEKMFMWLLSTLDVSDMAKSMIADAELCHAGTRSPATAVFSMASLMASAKSGKPPVPS